MLLSTAVDLYLGHVALAPLSLISYRQALCRFVRFVKPDNIPVQLLSSSICHRYSAHLGKHLAVSTHRHALIILCGFCRWMKAESLLKEDLAEDLTIPAKSRGLPWYLTQAQVTALLSQPDLSTPHGQRDAAMLEMLYATGLRVSELCALPLSAIYPRWLKVRGKGGKERLVPYGETSRTALQRYLAGARAQCGPAGCPSVWLTRWGPISPRWFALLLCRYAHSAGLSHVWPHLLRHTFATHLLWNRTDLRAIQSYLGHADLSSTEIYLHLGNPQLWATYRRHHPRA